jgi:hypothetical protein
MTLTADEIQALKSGEITEDELFDQQIEEQKLELKQVESAKDFILGRSKNTTDCIIESNGEAIVIKIYTKLSKSQIKANREFLIAMQSGDDEIFESEKGNELAAKFLATITVDDELDEDFWKLDELDAQIPAVIMTTYLNSVLETSEAVEKFRKNR